MADLNPCPKCGAAAFEPHLLTIFCRNCDARTANFTGTRGEFQREYRAVREAWNRGDVLTVRDGTK